ncbi:MAG: twin-arginine translocase subunit TatC [Rickettsiales bacterium]|jgi:sec-independent protein translocase protein TatC|nr:twin-arginine translocase subunit TatC [Rickettsiales bacterium]
MKMTIAGHFRELRRRIIWCLLAFAAAFFAGLSAAPLMRDFLSAPLLDAMGENAMIMTGVADGLSVEFSMAGLFAMCAAIPFFLQQLWAYAAPALKQKEKKIAIGIILASPLLFCAGAAFAYFVLLPAMFKFFISISAGAALTPDMKNYLEFSVGMMKAFGMSFQLPLALVMLNRAGAMPKKRILSAARYATVGIFVFAAAITPPDIVSQIALAAPLWLLFAMSLLFLK